MPTWSSLGSWSADLSKLAKDLEREEAQRITREMGEKAQDIAEAAASADLGGDPRFSGWAPTLDTQIKTRGDSTWLLPTKQSAGPWTVAQTGRNVGETGRFLGPGATRSGGAVRRRADGSVARVRTGRGKRWNGVTRGKGTADDAFSRMERELPKIAQKGVRKAIAKRFDVS
jgi:hypothetical protein